MGLFDNKYPYTDFHELNLDWIISEVQRLNQNLDDLEDKILKEVTEYAKEYVDGRFSEVLDQFAKVERDFEALKVEVDSKIVELGNQYSQFTRQINAEITLMENRISQFHDEIEADIIGVNARTDLAIEQNNQRLLEQMETYLANIKVVNYFTGTKITVQSMFDFLCSLHAEHGITFDTLASRQKTYDYLRGLNITYTQLAFNGDILIV